MVNAFERQFVSAQIMQVKCGFVLQVISPQKI